MKTRFLSIVTLAATLLGVEALALPGGQAHAQEVQITGPLAGAPAVHHLRLYRKGRLQLSPVIGITMQEPYRRTMFLGGQLNYHLTDWLGIGVWGAYGGVGFDTNLTNNIQDQGVTTERNQLSLPTRAGFPKQVGKIQGLVAFQVTFIPLRGKLALFQRLFLDTDFYLFGGVGAVFREERHFVTAASCTSLGTIGDQNACFNASQLNRAHPGSVTPTFGAGFTMYFTSWIGLAVEWRGFFFKMNPSGFDVSGGPSGTPDGKINGADRIASLTQMFNLNLVFTLGRSRVTD